MWRKSFFFPLSLSLLSFFFDDGKKKEWKISTLRPFFTSSNSLFLVAGMQPSPASLLPPKKRQQAQQVEDVASVPSEAKPDLSEGDKGVEKSSSNNKPTSSIVEPSSSIADTTLAVETSKIRGLAPPRKPRVGEQYQADLPELLEQPAALQKR